MMIFPWILEVLAYTIPDFWFKTSIICVALPETHDLWLLLHIHHVKSSGFRSFTIPFSVLEYHTVYFFPSVFMGFIWFYLRCLP